jgi:hypothetical protein
VQRSILGVRGKASGLRRRARITRDYVREQLDGGQTSTANLVGELSLSGGGTERGKEETVADVALNSEARRERSNQT